MIRRFFILPIRAYQLILSPHLRNACRYTPSCSNYAIQAINKYGVPKGMVLAIWRVARCHPWAKHGYDPPRWFGESPEPKDGACVCE
ncbi:MAG: membrane protein insertion efficiency factor YidD [Rhodothermaceae bacterium]|nr:membrane protein insertion efficiency factor YidD [Bacteroidota bacterium]MXW14315.1 membrane protein insertion efficiency factor YidD [Rhodothermaceae bacterium]MXW32568.1 membrane protein insertion efficiency factor YidD [Rhodothermaceae bacterium]MXX96030.1 membrane protein insertion efficiency factor YidD [Rhodothermaceae bacterium]MXZ58099.1 membrane protein insertion efficiency factor YidD [Rhodothermaceae bacterium]